MKRVHWRKVVEEILEIDPLDIMNEAMSGDYPKRAAALGMETEGRVAKAAEKAMGKVRAIVLRHLDSVKDQSSVEG